MSCKVLQPGSTAANCNLEVLQLRIENLNTAQAGKRPNFLCPTDILFTAAPAHCWVLVLFTSDSACRPPYCASFANLGSIVTSTLWHTTCIQGSNLASLTTLHFELLLHTAVGVISDQVCQDCWVHARSSSITLEICYQRCAAEQYLSSTPTVLAPPLQAPLGPPNSFSTARPIASSHDLLERLTNGSCMPRFEPLFPYGESSLRPPDCKNEKLLVVTSLKMGSFEHSCFDFVGLVQITAPGFVAQANLRSTGVGCTPYRSVLPGEVTAHTV